MKPDDILSFWFSEQARPYWFASTADFDREVTACFHSTWQAAATGDLDAWADSPAGALALVIVLDQFPLHMFRGRAEAFSTEARARAVTRRALARHWDQSLAPEQRAFLYLPLMHSESPVDQEDSVALYEALGQAESLYWAQHHRELIRRFGRFPHRNAVLGRVSTPQEEAYLASAEAFRG
ncbi:MAG: DUF924 family protein [Thiohalomonadaceae bacterium]